MRLDLGILAQETLDITLLDGKVICVKKPSKGLLVEINKADIELTRVVDFEELVNKLESITAKILTNNAEKLQFKAEELEDLGIDYSMQTAIFKAYMEFISATAKN